MFIKCQSCYHNIEASEEYYGEDIECPSCSVAVSIPYPETEVDFNSAMPTPASTKACPFCAESINAKAIKCKHCGSNLNGESGELGPLILIIPFISTLLILFWVGEMNLLQNPSSSLWLITIGTIILTSALIYLDAKRLKIADQSGNGPFQWAVFSLFLWIVGYPLYFYVRKKWGAKNLIIGGLIVTLVFVATAGLMNKMIEDKKAQIRRVLNY